jgi:hypothetical protein
MAEPAIVVLPLVPPRLSHDELVIDQRETLSAPRRRYNSIAARALFMTLDLVYGRPRTMSKFRPQRAGAGATVWVDADRDLECQLGQAAPAAAASLVG